MVDHHHQQQQQQQTNRHHHESSKSSPSARQTVKFLTAVTIGLSLLLLSGLTLTGTVMGLIVATPLMVLFSPVLIPAVITLALLTIGFMFSGVCGAAAATAMAWIYKYVTGKHPMGADKVDYARMMISEKAKELGHFAHMQTHQNLNN